MSEKDTPKERPSSPCEARATAQIDGISVKNAWAIDRPYRLSALDRTDWPPLWVCAGGCCPRLASPRGVKHWSRRHIANVKSRNIAKYGDHSVTIKPVAR